MNTGSIELLVGISASGKSTYAHKKWSKDPKGTIVVSRDKIREMLFSYTETSVADYYDYNKNPNMLSCEKEVTRYQGVIIREALSQGKHVIVDDTNLSKRYIESYRYWNVPTKITVFPADKKKSVEWDSNRTKKVGKDLIDRQYQRYKIITKILEEEGVDLEVKHRNMSAESLKHRQEVFILDLDGTIAWNINRSPYDQSKADTDLEDYAVARIVKNLDLPIIICTGRSEENNEATLKWLEENSVPYEKIFFRKAGDTRPDWIVKEEMWDEIEKDYDIVAMFDDRSQVVDRARALGYKVLQVEYHTF